MNPVSKHDGSELFEYESLIDGIGDRRILSKYESEVRLTAESVAVVV